MNREKERKLLLWVMLVSSLTAVVIWYVRALVEAPVVTWGSVTARTFSFFTISTNSLIILMTGALLWGRGRLYDWFKSPVVQAACCLYIAFVGLGFWLLLGGPGELRTIWDWLPEIGGHSLSPILGFVFWWRCVEKGAVNGRHPFLWLIYPILYLVYWLIRGPLVGYYPYFFIDVNALGYSGVALWSGILVIAYLVLGTAMWQVDRWQARRA